MAISRRERLTLNPVKAKFCEIPGLAKDAARVGYIKLVSFTQNASGEYLYVFLPASVFLLVTQIDHVFL